MRAGSPTFPFRAVSTVTKQPDSPWIPESQPHQNWPSVVVPDVTPAVSCSCKTWHRHKALARDLGLNSQVEGRHNYRCNDWEPGSPFRKAFPASSKSCQRCAQTKRYFKPTRSAKSCASGLACTGPV